MRALRVAPLAVPRVLLLRRRQAAPPAPRRAFAVAARAAEVAAAPRAPAAVDYSALSAATWEVSALAAAAKVQTVVQTDAHTVVLGLRTASGRAWVWLCWHPQAGRLCLGAPPPRAPDADAFSLGAALRAALAGRALLAAETPLTWERVSRLEFGPRPGDPPSAALLLELTGAHANLWLTDGRGVITAAGSQQGERHTRARPLATGDQYAFPPPARGVLPADGAAPLPLPDWRAAVAAAAAASAPPGKAPGTGAQLGPALARTFTGASPALARALCAAAGVAHDAPVAELRDAEWSAVHGRFGDWLHALASRQLRPGDFGLPPPAPAAWLARAEGAGPVGAAIDVAFTRFGAAEAFTRRAAALLSRVRAAAKRAAGRVTAFRAAADGEAAAAEHRRLADLLMSQLHLAQPGATHVDVVDWETGAPVRVALKASESALQAAQALYGRAKKAKRGAVTCAPLLQAALAELEYLSQVETQLTQLEPPHVLAAEAAPGGAAAAAEAQDEALRMYGSADDERERARERERRAAEEEAAASGSMAALREIEAELMEGGYATAAPDAAAAAAAAVRRGRPGNKSSAGSKGKVGKAGGAEAASGDAAPGVRRFRAPSGTDVFVGRNNRGNEIVSHTLARDDDVWFHVRGAPGAHVLLRLPPGQDAAQEDMQFAADLAAYYSRRVRRTCAARACTRLTLRTGAPRREKLATKALVSYTSPRYVRRAPGGHLGMVTMAKEEVMTARPSNVAGQLGNE